MGIQDALCKGSYVVVFAFWRDNSQIGPTVTREFDLYDARARSVRLRALSKQLVSAMASDATLLTGLLLDCSGESPGSQHIYTRPEIGQPACLSWNALMNLLVRRCPGVVQRTFC